MIKVNKYETQLIEHFDPEGNSLGFLNDSESIDLRCQIAENQLEGYYVIFQDEKIMINKRGEIEKWKIGMYDINQILSARLFRARKKQIEDERSKSIDN